MHVRPHLRRCDRRPRQRPRGCSAPSSRGYRPDVRYADPYGVSNRTASTADLDDIPFDAVDAKDDAYRAAALTLVNTAISKLEAEHETNRLDVLAQTRRIVDNAVPADVPVPAVA
jgi:hypothetical protein